MMPVHRNRWALQSSVYAFTCQHEKAHRCIVAVGACRKGGQWQAGLACSQPVWCCDGPATGWVSTEPPTRRTCTAAIGMGKAVSKGSGNGLLPAGVYCDGPATGQLFHCGAGGRTCGTTLAADAIRDAPSGSWLPCCVVPDIGVGTCSRLALLMPCCAAVRCPCGTGRTARFWPTRHLPLARSAAMQFDRSSSRLASAAQRVLYCKRAPQ